MVSSRFSSALATKNQAPTSSDSNFSETSIWGACESKDLEEPFTMLTGMGEETALIEEPAASCKKEGADAEKEFKEEAADVDANLEKEHFCKATVDDNEEFEDGWVTFRRPLVNADTASLLAMASSLGLTFGPAPPWPCTGSMPQQQQPPGGGYPGYS